MEAIEVSKICKCLSEINRINIIDLLSKAEICACDLLEELNISQSTLSYHMKQLSECGLVNVRSEGKWNYYSINCEKFKEFKSYFEGIKCTETGRCSCL